MTTIGVDELQHNLADYLTRVQAGETLLVTQEGWPDVEINPVKSSQNIPCNELHGHTAQTLRSTASRHWKLELS